MKLSLLACLLVVAGAYAVPISEVAAPTQGRIVDYWMIHAIEVLSQWMKNSGYDPLELNQAFAVNLFDETVKAAGFVHGLRFTGASVIYIDNLYYNMYLNRLDINLLIPKLLLEIEYLRIELSYGNTKVDLEISGSLSLHNVRLQGDALIRVIGGGVYVTNINPHFSIEAIEANPTVYESGTDYSSTVLEFLTVTVPNYLVTYKYEINTVIGELIKGAVNRRW